MPARERDERYENGDKNLEDVLNSTQLAIKVSLNSVFGFVSRAQGNLVLKQLGQLTTSTGRKLINQSKNYVENEFIDYIHKNNLIKYELKANTKLIENLYFAILKLLIRTE